MLEIKDKFGRVEIREKDNNGLICLIVETGGEEKPLAWEFAFFQLNKAQAQQIIDFLTKQLKDE